MPEEFLVGETARLDLRITDIAGIAVDPASGTLKIKPPRSAAIAHPLADLAHDATGQYHLDIALTAAGTWYYRLDIGDPVTAAAEGAITVQPSRFLP